MIKFKKILLILFFSILLLSKSFSNNEDDIYQKIDLFGEVLEKINKEYVDEINQSESMDSAINGLLQSLDPYSGYMNQKTFEESGRIRALTGHGNENERPHIWN